MNKVLTVTLGLLVCFSTSLSQESRRAEAKLVLRAYIGGDFLHVIEEAALDLKEYAAEPGDTAALRDCSKEPLPVALTTALASPFFMVENLEHYGFCRCPA